MLMKYNDFKSLSKDDMKQIMGGLIEIPNCAVGQAPSFFQKQILLKQAIVMRGRVKRLQGYH